MSQEFYRGQLAQAGNAITALAVAQNLSVSLAIIDEQPIIKYFYSSGPKIVVSAILAGNLIYIAMIWIASRLEISVLEPEFESEKKLQKRLINWLIAGRMACVVLTAALLTYLAWSFSVHLPLPPQVTAHEKECASNQKSTAIPLSTQSP